MSHFNAASFPKLRARVAAVVTGTPQTLLAAGQKYRIGWGLVSAASTLAAPAHITFRSVDDAITYFVVTLTIQQNTVVLPSGWEIPTGGLEIASDNAVGVDVVVWYLAMTGSVTA